jgi:diguanylate cyclase (GGDEF)-like protein
MWYAQKVRSGRFRTDSPFTLPPASDAPLSRADDPVFCRLDLSGSFSTVPIQTVDTGYLHVRQGRRGDEVVASRRSVLAIRMFGLISWGTLLTTTFLLLTGLTAASQEEAIQSIAPVVFLSIIAQLLIASVVWRRRRPQALALAFGTLMWAGGAMALNSSDPTATQFPAPGEWLFLSAYAGMATYVIMSGHRNWDAPFITWLEAGIACGGAASLAGLTIALPFVDDFASQGLISLLTALIYPTLDFTLISLVIGQILLHNRSLNVRTWLLVGGFLLLLVGDTSLVAASTSGTYGYGISLVLSWTIGSLLLAWSAVHGITHSERPTTDAAEQGPTMRTGMVVVLAAAIALANLVFRPGGPVQPYLVVPAVLTLLGVGLRLILALHQAQQAAEARRLSRTDDLTGLPNRRALIYWLYTRVQEDRPLALLLMDLDRFKEINDSIGHAAGDTVLQIIAQRLRRVAADHGRDTRVARLGGDEFALLVHESDPQRLTDLAESLRAAVREHCRIEGIQLRIATSVGIAVNGGDVTSGTDMLRCADIAMYQAKSTDQGILLYDSSQDEFSRDRLQLAEDLRESINSNQLEVWYQPQVEAGTSQLLAVEALVRWKHPQQGILPPMTFLPIARRLGLMASLTEYVMSRAIGDAIRWHAQGLPLRVSINVAPPELLTDGVLRRLFDDAASSGLPAGTIVVEVTEESFISDPDRAMTAISQLREHGIEVSLDDYGTGYSSLAYLRNLSLNELKIDREFVKDILTDDDSRVIVVTTNQLAHGLGMRTVAEGVENAEIAAVLTELGVDVLQGYHFSRPIPAQELGEWTNSLQQKVAAPR